MTRRFRSAPSRDIPVSRAKKISPAVLDQVPHLIGLGLSTRQIADAIGCTVGTLRVKCSQMGISLRSNCRKERRSTTSVNNRFKSRAGSGQTKLNASGLLPARKQLGASPRYLQSLSVPLAPSIVEQLIDRATEKGLAATTLASMLLEVIARDGLYDAIIDEDGSLAELGAKK
jgi:hypothetical protein